jgi:iron complex transport system substrate-binding protein
VKHFALTATLLAGLAFSPAAFAQEQTITHAQGETVITGVPAKVLVSDWAAFDNLTALGLSLIHISEPTRRS